MLAQLGIGLTSDSPPWANFGVESPVAKSQRSTRTKLAMGSLWLGRRKPLFTALKYSLALSAGLAAHSGAAEPPASCDPGAADYQDCQSDSSPPAAGSAADNDPRVAPSTNLDWVTIDQLREDQRSRVRPNCCGAYLD